MIPLLIHFDYNGCQLFYLAGGFPRIIRLLPTGRRSRPAVLGWAERLNVTSVTFDVDLAVRLSPKVTEEEAFRRWRTAGPRLLSFELK